jgi:hypothetical protein
VMRIASSCSRKAADPDQRYCGTMVRGYKSRNGLSGRLPCSGGGKVSRLKPPRPARRFSAPCGPRRMRMAGNLGRFEPSPGLRSSREKTRSG